MISHVIGKLIEKTPAFVVVETGGIGLKIWIPLSSFEVLGDVGNRVRVLTYLHAREDNLQLFGFATPEEKNLFQLLITVSGIGPRLAQGVLSGISVETFQRAILDHDIGVLTSAPGVGKKTAERLVLELREKIVEPTSDGSSVSVTSKTPISEEAVKALVSLGYKRIRAETAVQNVLRDESSLSLEDVIRRVLRQ